MIPSRMLVTTCPDCATTFKLTVALLEKAGGQVRCGRCATVFDANLSLREQEEAPTIRIATGDRPPDDEGEFALETGTGSRWIFRDRPPDDRSPAGGDVGAGPAAGDIDAGPADADAADLAEAETEASPPVSAEAAASFTDEPPDQPFTVADLVAAIPAVDAAASPAGGPIASAAGPTASPADAADVDPAAATDSADFEPETEPATEAPDWLPPLSTNRPARTGLWATGAVSLLLVLASQIIHALRHDLAALPGVGRALVATYAGLGLELAPAIDLAQYDTVDLTAVAEPITAEHGWLIIETRVQNKGPNVQPFPYIFVGLLDRWQETIAGRYFRPDEYMLTPVSDYSRMRVGSTVDAQFIIVDPGPSATGFVLEFCAPLANSYVCETG